MTGNMTSSVGLMWETGHHPEHEQSENNMRSLLNFHLREITPIWCGLCDE